MCSLVLWWIDSFITMQSLPLPGNFLCSDVEFIWCSYSHCSFPLTNICIRFFSLFYLNLLYNYIWRELLATGILLGHVFWSTLSIAVFYLIHSDHFPFDVIIDILELNSAFLVCIYICVYVYMYIYMYTYNIYVYINIYK